MGRNNGWWASLIETMNIQRFDNRDGNKDVWVVTHDDISVFHFATVSVGQLIDTKYDYIDNHIPNVDGWESRLEIVMDLMQRAVDSGLPIPIPQFLKESMSLVIDYINDNSTGLKDKFKSASVADYPWLDMRISEDAQSPREVALELL